MSRSEMAPAITFDVDHGEPAAAAALADRLHNEAA
jgi:hypothetical protein